ncbi:hypothetical protein [Corynebacterium xerosis]|uniref:hypothetical protein n=1 Tax=Corynebacterium xerosis TaxID=1725 RepID=UPI0013CE85AC|nr:hypothetical protein [Corynebacterium xerosis]
MDELSWRGRRLEKMVDMGNPLATDGAGVRAAWPEDVLKDSRGRTVGFIMPLLEPSTVRSLNFLMNPSDRMQPGREGERNGFHDVHWGHLVKVAVNLCRAFALLHAHGVVFGDVSGKNILVSERGLVTFIDCDSFQVVDGGGNVYWPSFGTEEYCSPEHWANITGGSIIEAVRSGNRERLNEFRIKKASDNYSLAILIFRLLVQGNHPSGRGQWHGIGEQPGQRELMDEGNWCYGQHSPFKAGKAIPKRELFPPDILLMFEESIGIGAQNPALRPTAQKWAEALEKIEFGRCGEDPSHMGSMHRSTCPWCELESKQSGAPLPAAAKLTRKVPKVPVKKRKSTRQESPGSGAPVPERVTAAAAASSTSQITPKPSLVAFFLGAIAAGFSYFFSTLCASLVAAVILISLPLELEPLEMWVRHLVRSSFVYPLIFGFACLVFGKYKWWWMVPVWASCLFVDPAVVFEFKIQVLEVFGLGGVGRAPAEYLFRAIDWLSPNWIPAWLLICLIPILAFFSNYFALGILDRRFFAPWSAGK